MKKVLRTEWYDKTVKALQINGKGERTQQADTGLLEHRIESDPVSCSKIAIC